jgi:ABC-type Fe3+ transport system substrate-binding protein
MWEHTRFNRRQLIRGIGLLGMTSLAAACSQPAVPAPTTAPPKPTSAPSAAPTSAPAVAAPTTPSAKPTAAASEWDQVVAAANAEKTVAVATYAGTGHRKVIEAFQAAYPGIQVEHSQFQSSSRDYIPRVLQELKAGLHSFDLALMPPQEMLRQLRPVDGLAPIRPALIRPDVLDDKNWLDNFESGFLDKDKRWGYALVSLKSDDFWINTEMVNESEIRSLKDILDPKWKGKIVGGDPRTKGSGFQPATVMRLMTSGDDIMKRLYVDQEVVVSADARQLTEFMVRGRYPIGVGAIDRVILKDFQAQGIGNGLKPIDIPEGTYLYSQTGILWMLNGPPHPNAAKVYANWLLSKEGGAAWSEHIGDNSRRSDVPVADESKVPTRGVQYLNIQAEDLLDEQQKTQDLAKQLLN